LGVAHEDLNAGVIHESVKKSRLNLESASQMIALLIRCVVESPIFNVRRTNIVMIIRGIHVIPKKEAQIVPEFAFERKSCVYRKDRSILKSHCNSIAHPRQQEEI
jgi:hypothetical protein